VYNLNDATLQNLRKTDVHMKSLNIVCYQLPCTVKDIFLSFFVCGFLRKCYAITDKEDEPM